MFSLCQALCSIYGNVRPQFSVLRNVSGLDGGIPKDGRSLYMYSYLMIPKPAFLLICYTEFLIKPSDKTNIKTG